MRGRLRDYAILLGVSAILTLQPRRDEPLGRRRGRSTPKPRMRDNDTWGDFPSFNSQLRTAKQ